MSDNRQQEVVEKINSMQAELMAGPVPAARWRQVKIIIIIIIIKVGRGVQLFKGEDGTLIISGPAAGSRHVVGFNGTGRMFAC